MKDLIVIGIGMGAPAHLTAEAADAIRACDAFLVPDKGETTDQLVDARQRLVEAVRGTSGYDFVRVPDPERPSDGDPVKERYRAGVAEWRRARALANVEVLDRLPEDAVIGLLAWGDPAFYDSTIRMAHDVAEVHPATVRVIAGLSAFQILAAHAGMGLNTVGSSVHITPGRRLVDEWHPGLGTVVVMLDSYLKVAELAPAHPAIRIVWGAYVGLAQEVIIEGPLGEVIDEIAAVRARLRDEHGWVMDTYALFPPQ